MSDVKAKTLWELPGLGGFKGPTSEGRVERWRWKGRKENDRGRKRRGGLHPYVQNPEKYPDCRTDLIGGAATQAFATGGKYPRAVTVCSTPCMRQIFNQQLKRTEKVLKVLGLNVKVKVIENPLTASKFKVF